MKMKAREANIGEYFQYGTLVYKVVCIDEDGKLILARWDKDKGEIQVIQSSLDSQDYVYSILKGSFRPISEDNILSSKLIAYKYQKIVKDVSI